MTIVFWDTEFTSWEGCNENGWARSEGQYREIIQIGAVKRKDNGETETFNRYVRPIINQKLSEYIQKLTGISQTDVDGAEPLDSVWRDFEKWRNGVDAYSWGNDITVVEENFELYDLEKARLNKEQYHDIRPKFRSEGVPVDEFTSGELYTYFTDESELSDHDALDDSRSLAISWSYIE